MTDLNSIVNNVEGLKNLIKKSLERNKVMDSLISGGNLVSLRMVLEQKAVFDRKIQDAFLLIEIDVKNLIGELKIRRKLMKEYGDSLKRDMFGRTNPEVKKS